MNVAEKLLAGVSKRLELPADVIAGVPRIEMIGNNQFSIEPHRGLSGYSNKEIQVATNIGMIAVRGNDIRIKCMNAARVAIEGELHTICFMEMNNE